MEREIEEELSKSLIEPGCVGVVANDSQGLPILAKGVCEKIPSGYLSSLAERSRLLSPEDSEPNIVIESDSYKIYVKKMGDVCCAIYKTNAI